MKKPKMPALVSGPWTVDYEVSEDGPLICGGNMRGFLQVYTAGGATGRSTVRAITALPELLAAAITLCEGIPSEAAWDKAWIDLRAAIAKARGEDI